MPHADRSFVSHDGLKPYYRDYAGDPKRLPVLCLHGLTRNSADFAKLAERISPARRVIAPDQRGRGRSQYDPAWLNYLPTTYVGDMWRLLGELALPRVIVVGTSMGGLMAMTMAAINPQAIAGVVLNDIGAEIDSVGGKRIQDYVGRLPPVRDWNEAVAQMRTTFASAFPDFSEEDWRAYARASYTEDAQGVPRLASDPHIGDALRSIPPAPPGTLWMLFGALRRIPTLVIRGAYSDVLSASTVTRMHKEKPDLKSIVVPNRGHPPLLDEPECVAALDEFLAHLSE
jgi:pimeloyl-ACP methyl ester carboxylesterase